ncbi:sugar ABC transporter substrate-binding protein [Cryobacterium sp. PH31-O1]|uniref:sugar ABC transporter substrate-binding protein n=1 Tax=Cryobacterium sp. PH31-O1 TaxID=3046306 RepID=UPI0024B93EA1|nr:sugar ABC transporter substrate-binding protein [Cryobacterium sp. PH31-O1]MDJ0336684.1 sugar ABC transporter substrate-binding protein [Cryobacterium sp. PH31-O1]
MTIKRFTAIAAAAAAVVLTLSACGTVGGTTPDASSGDTKTVAVTEITIGFLQRQLDAPYYSAMQAMAEQIAGEQGFKLLFQNASGDPVTQLDQAQTMLSQGADVLVINAISPETQRAQLEQIAEQVPLLFIDTGIPDVGVTSVSSDNLAVGKLSGELAAKRFEAGSTIDVGVLNGGPNDVIVGPARQQGFLDGLEAGGIKYTLVAETPALYAQDKAVPATESMLAANPNLDLILGLNDSMALGALTVLADQGNTTTLVAASADGQKEALVEIAKGCSSQYVSTGLNSPALATQRAFEIAIALGTGQSTSSDFKPEEYTTAEGINCDNVADFYDAKSVF